MSGSQWRFQDSRMGGVRTRATHLNMRMHGNTLEVSCYCHKPQHRNGFRSFMRSNHARFTALSIIASYPGPNGRVRWAKGTKNFGVCVDILACRER